jgi:hypothetical protein
MFDLIWYFILYNYSEFLDPFHLVRALLEDRNLDDILNSGTK